MSEREERITNGGSDITQPGARKYFTQEIFVCFCESLCVPECGQIIAGSFNDFIRLFSTTEDWGPRAGQQEEQEKENREPAGQSESQSGVRIERLSLSITTHKMQ